MKPAARAGSADAERIRCGGAFFYARRLNLFGVIHEEMSSEGSVELKGVTLMDRTLMISSLIIPSLVSDESVANALPRRPPPLKTLTPPYKKATARSSRQEKAESARASCPKLTSFVVAAATRRYVDDIAPQPSNILRM